MTSGVRQSGKSIPGLAAAGRWLFLCGVLLMVTGDGPASTVRISKWPSPVPWLAWPWLYLVLITASFVCLAVGRGVTSWRPAHLRFLVPALACLLAAMLASTIFSQVPSLSWVAFLTVMGIVAFGWIVSAVLEGGRPAGAMWPVIAVAVLLLALRVIVWRRDEGLDVVAYQIVNNAWVGKLQLAWVFNLFAPLLMARLLGERTRSLAALYAISWAVAGIATYLLFSRMGSIVFALTTIGVCALNHTYWRKWILVMGIGAVLGGGLFIRSAETFRHVAATLIEYEQNPGVGMRLGVWRDALRLFREHPIVGIGLGTFDEVSYSLPGTTAEPLFFRKGWHAHNVYLHVLAETGLIGLLAWCYFWLVIVGHLGRAWVRGDSRERLNLTGSICALVGFLTLAMTEVLIGARVHASLRMNLTIGLVVALALYDAARVQRRP
jgi:O-antigen ligase